MSTSQSLLSKQKKSDKDYPSDEGKGMHTKSEYKGLKMDGSEEKGKPRRCHEATFLQV
jgi:hypothetical protein